MGSVGFGHVFIFLFTFVLGGGNVLLRFSFSSIHPFKQALVQGHCVDFQCRNIKFMSGSCISEGQERLFSSLLFVSFPCHQCALMLVLGATLEQHIPGWGTSLSSTLEL